MEDTKDTMKDTVRAVEVQLTDMRSKDPRFKRYTDPTPKDPRETP